MSYTHLWVTNLEKAPTHFKTSKTRAALQLEYATLINELKPLIKQGLSAAVYTQTTDVESEVNGLMIYDREILKIPADTLRALHEPLYQLFRKTGSGSMPGGNQNIR